MMRFQTNRRIAFLGALFMSTAAAVLVEMSIRSAGWNTPHWIWGLCLAGAGLAGCLAFLAGSKPQAEPEETERIEGAEVYRATTQALASAVAAQDFHEQHHVARVQTIVEQVGRALDIDEDTMEGIRVAATVHDVGKLGVPEYILLKPGRLDPEEFTKITNHAAVGAKILGQVSYPWDVAGMVRHHHERYDGTGYPDHLKGDQIPLGARIIAVAEVYDSLVSERCYRKGWSHQRAIEHIESMSGHHFDPQVVQALMEVEGEIALLNQTRPSTGDDSHLRGLVCENPTAAAEIARANRELMSLSEIAETLSSTLELDEVLNVLAHKTKRLTGAAACAVLLPEEARPDNMVARAAVGRHVNLIMGACAKHGQGATGQAARDLKAYSGPYDANDLSFYSQATHAPEFKSCAIAPVYTSGKLLGTINLYSTSPDGFSSDDVSLLMSVASRAALAIQNATAFENVRDSALKDPVTGLYNGRYLRNYLDRELSRSARRAEPLSVVGMDLDNFKAVNDSHGHRMGDEVLMDMAEIFKHELREYDLVVRNGGDEFVAVLPDTVAQEAVQTAQRIQREVELYAERVFGNRQAALGVSVGVASYPDDACDAEMLLARADAAMYRDKRARKEGKLAA